MIDSFPLSFVLPLVVHALAGLTTGVTGVLAFRAPKRRGRHHRWGTRYLCAYTLVFLTAILLSVQHWPADAYLFVLATLGYGLALVGYAARRFRQEPRARPLFRKQWVVAHIVGMIGSYTVLWTAFYVDNAHLIPGLKELPTLTFWVLPTAIALPFLVVSLSRFAPQTVRPDAIRWRAKPRPKPREAEDEQVEGRLETDAEGRSRTIVVSFPCIDKDERVGCLSRGGNGMNLSNHGQPHERESVSGAAALVVPLESLDRTSLPLAGGKAANLGELLQAGFAGPPGFCVTTTAYARVSTRAGLDPYLEGLEAVDHLDSTRQIELATAIRTVLMQTALPPEVIEAVTSAYQSLSAGEPVPVSVRSSATAEDLPDASFAGQQETLLNVIGSEALLAAVQRCFASLWTDRATQYRSNLGMAPRDVRLAVVVQRMVEAEVAGVLFTANPLTGKRREAVIDANPGLGEAVVSGATNPDHFVVQTTTGEIVERRLGEKQVIIQAAAGGGTQQIEADASSAHACLSDEQIRAVAKLGARVEALYGTPQDIEWAIDASGQVFLLQARPITTLFPLPAGAPSTDEDLGVYLAFGVQQGTYRPFTPMGLSALRLLASGLLALIGSELPDPLTGPRFVVEAAGRPFFEVTAALRHPFGRRFLIEAMREAEVHAAAAFEQLVSDPRLSLRTTPRRAFGRALVLLLARTNLPWYLLQAFFAPQAANRRVQRFVEQLRKASQVDARGDATTRLAEAERLLLRCLRLAFRVSPVMLAGIQSFALARRLLGDLTTESECQVVLGGSPTNPTTQMNQALWRLSQDVRTDEQSLHLLRQTPAEQLAQDYRQGRLPAPFQQGLACFLREYGHQSVSELDLGMPRWSEDPSYVLALLASYLDMEEGTAAPDLQLQRARQEARAMIATLAPRAARKGRLRGRLVRFCLERAHALAGFREMTRFVVGLVLAQARALLWTVGEAAVQARRLHEAEDLFFLTLSEAHALLSGADLRERVSERRANFARELGRRHVPLVLLSDGTEPLTETQKGQDAVQAARTLHGTPASAGRVTAIARVILDPHSVRLSPGEILVAPSTDPGWTPLFLKASGLVMEVGGAMAHGAIVAREYGLPAVVGVAGATERIATGSRLTLDGTTGAIVIESNA